MELVGGFFNKLKVGAELLEYGRSGATKIVFVCSALQQHLLAKVSSAGDANGNIHFEQQLHQEKPTQQHFPTDFLVYFI